MDAPSGRVTYRVDPRPSRFTVQVTAAGLLSSFGHNPVIAIRDFTAEAQFQPEKPETASLHLVAQAGSLEVMSEVSDKDRREIESKMHGDVLQSDGYPEIVFDSTSVKANSASPGQYWLEISGKLTLHGITREQDIRARLTANAERLRASGEFSLRQTDYGIELVSAVGGALKVKDELKCSFDMVASAVKAEEVAA